MAKISAGLLGGFSGKLGTMVGAIVKGQSTVRAYQKYVTNPKSARQMQVRDQFSRVWSFIHSSVTAAYKKTNMLGYGVVGGMQFMAGQFLAKYDYMRLNPADIALELNKWFRKTICNGVTFREDLFANWHNEGGPHFVPDGVTTPEGALTVYSYFGSDVPIEGRITIGYIDPYEDMASEPLLNLRETDYLIIEDTPNEIGLPAVAGWQSSKAACGFWNYIYKVNFAEIVNFEIYNMGAATHLNINIGVTGAQPMESGNCRVALNV